MVLLDRALISLIYFGGGLAFLFSLGQFIRPGIHMRQIILALFFASIGVIQSHAGLTHSRDMLLAPHLLLLNVPAIYFCGPLMAAYLEAVSQSDPRFRAAQHMQFVPLTFTIGLGLALIYAMMGLRTMLSLLRGTEPVWEYQRPLTVLFVLLVTAGTPGNIGYFLGPSFWSGWLSLA